MPRLQKQENGRALNRRELLRGLGAADAHANNVVKILTDITKAADMKGLPTTGLTWGEVINNLTEDYDEKKEQAASQPQSPSLDLKRLGRLNTRKPQD